MRRIACRSDVLATPHPADGFTSCFLASHMVGKVSPRAWRSISPPTGTDPYLRNGGDLEVAARIAGHESTRTTQLYNRLREEISLDEIERIHI